MGGGEACPVSPFRVNEPKKTGAQRLKNPLVIYNGKLPKEENTKKYIVSIGI